MHNMLFIKYNYESKLLYFNIYFLFIHICNYYILYITHLNVHMYYTFKCTYIIYMKHLRNILTLILMCILILMLNKIMCSHLYGSFTKLQKIECSQNAYIHQSVCASDHLNRIPNKIYTQEARLPYGNLTAEWVLELSWKWQEQTLF